MSDRRPLTAAVTRAGATGALIAGGIARRHCFRGARLHDNVLAIANHAGNGLAVESTTDGHPDRDPGPERSEDRSSGVAVRPRQALSAARPGTLRRGSLT